jgi:dihydrofolate reductase
VAKLIYTAIASLDGYVADGDGRFDWSTPDEEVHAVVNDLERGVGTYLLGRRMYEVLVAWETIDVVDQPPAIQEYATIWRSMDKVVYSSTLDAVSSARTRLEPRFDPEDVRGMKATSERDLAVGGPTLAAQAIAADLVDEYRLFLVPIVVGGGTAALPDGVVLPLELVDERRFGNGTIFLDYVKRR